MSTPSCDPNVRSAAAFWFINSLVTIVADAAHTKNSMTIYRQVAPLGFATPYHTHEAYGEAFYVLEGEITVVCDGEKSCSERTGSSFCLE